MRNYYIFVALLCVFSLALVATAIILTGTPVKLKAIQLDRTRLTDFSSLAIAANGYYMNNNKLPTSLGELKKDQDYLHTADPETSASYTYKVTSDKTFEICATFSLDSKDIPQDYPRPIPMAYDDNVSSSYSPYDSNREHKKGYDCLKYDVSDNKGIYEPAPMPSGKTTPEALMN